VFGAGTYKLNPSKKLITNADASIVDKPLIDYIMETMPQGEEGSLSVQESSNLAAYISTLPSAQRGKALYESADLSCATALTAKPVSS
jgi:cytochrome c